MEGEEVLGVGLVAVEDDILGESIDARGLEGVVGRGRLRVGNAAQLFERQASGGKGITWQVCRGRMPRRKEEG